MPKFIVTFARPASVMCYGHVEVESEDREMAEDAAENALMAGSVDLVPNNETLEYSRDHAATIQRVVEA